MYWFAVPNPSLHDTGEALEGKLHTPAAKNDNTQRQNHRPGHQRIVRGGQWNQTHQKQPAAKIAVSRLSDVFASDFFSTFSNMGPMVCLYWPGFCGKQRTWGHG